MKEIICSAGKGRLTEAACLDCALTSGNPPCGFDYSLLKVMFDNAERTRIHVSDIVGCLKQGYLKRTSPMPEYPHAMLTRTLGTLVHGILESNTDHAQAELAMDEEGIKGMTDRLYDNGRLVDYKTLRWMYPSKLPYSSHALQVNLYGYLLKKAGHVVTSMAIQYLDMSGPSKCRKCRVLLAPDIFGLACPKCGAEPKNAHTGGYLVDIPFMDEEEIKELVDTRRTELEAALEMGVAPPGEPSFLCGWCAFQPACEEGRDFSE